MKTLESKPKRDGRVRSSELVLRPADATHDALRKCLRWLDACRELEWNETVMPDLESLFWTYHDSAGNKKPQNNQAEPLPPDSERGRHLEYE